MRIDSVPASAIVLWGVVLSAGWPFVDLICRLLDVPGSRAAGSGVRKLPAICLFCEQQCVHVHVVA